MQKVATGGALSRIWLGYQDADGKPLKVRLHWASEWFVLHISIIYILYELTGARGPS